MCRAMDDLVLKTRQANAKEMLADGVLSLDKIAKYSNLPLEEVERLAAELPQ